MKWDNQLINHLQWSNAIINREGKEIVAREIAAMAEEGDVIGAGSGSTVYLTLFALAERIRKESLHIEVIPASAEISMTCIQLGIPQTTLWNKRPDWAFDGALKNKKGLFEVANHGTIFLDEIGEMAFELQARLLRVLETGEYIKIGDTKPTKVDVRIISATNRDLKKEIENGNFREDLYFRLSVFQICLPPLRERKDDIESLSYMFLNKFANKLNKKITGITPEVLDILKNAEWKGNVRELRNVIERCSIVCEEQITFEDLPLDLQKRKSDISLMKDNFELAEIERMHIIKVLQYTNGNKTETARLLKIGLATLYRKIETYKISM